MKIYAVQMQIKAEAFEENFETIQKEILKAKASSCHLVVFPENCLSGSMLDSLWDSPSFFAICETYHQKMMAISDSIGILYISHGQWFCFLDGVQKTLQSDALSTPILNIKNYKIALLSAKNLEISDEIDFIICLKNEFFFMDSSPFQWPYSKPGFLLNAVGTQNTGKAVYALMGLSKIIDANAQVLYEAPFLEEKSFLLEWNQAFQLLETPSVPLSYWSRVQKALIYMIRENLYRWGIKKIVIGASGGIDSALAAVLYTKALGPQNVILVNLPTQFNSQITKNAAKKLAENLTCPYLEIPISDTLEVIKNNIETYAKNSLFAMEGVHFENLQARARSSMFLASIASMNSAAFTSNANKTELFTGYCTLYGDTSGVLCALGDLWKTEVYALAEAINMDSLVIPTETLTIRPSAELSEEHNIEEGRGDPIQYEYHDLLFRYWLQSKRNLEDTKKLLLDGNFFLETKVPPKIFNKLFSSIDEAVLDMTYWWKRYKGIALAKRLQTPPILQLHQKELAFGAFIESQN